MGGMDHRTLKTYPSDSSIMGKLWQERLLQVCGWGKVLNNFSGWMTL